MIIKDYRASATESNHSIIELNYNPAIHIIAIHSLEKTEWLRQKYWMPWDFNFFPYTNSNGLHVYKITNRYKRTLSESNLYSYIINLNSIKI